MPRGVQTHQGTEDNFHAQNQLLPQNLADAASSAGINGVQIRMQEGYDHSYYFVASFADQHVEYAARFLKA
jgi:S-formylglutathione hydrolase